MTKTENEFLISSCTIRDFIVDNRLNVNGLPNGQKNSDTIITTIDQIQKEVKIQNTSKTGYVTFKDDLRDKLIYEADETVRKLIVFAKFTNNLILLDEITTAKRKLKKCSKADLTAYSQIIYDRSQANINLLSPYSITAATQTLLQTAIATYNPVIGKTGIGRAERVQSTQRLKVLFVILRTAINGLTDAIEIVRNTKVDFYNGYKSARKVIKNGATKKMLKCTVRDVDGKPIEDVFVILTQLDKDGNLLRTKSSIIKKKTRKKGGFNLPSAAEGKYMGTFEKIGFVKEQIRFTLSKRQRFDLKVVLKSQ